MASYFHIPFYTFGGLFFWQDVAFFGGWRIQKSIFFNKYRLLDPHYISRFCGDKRSCLSSLSQFSRDWEFTDSSDEVTLVLGSLFKTHFSFSSFIEVLNRSGYNSIYLNYSPFLCNLRESSLCLVSVLSHLSPSIKRVNFICFGVGGLIFRDSLRYSSSWSDKVLLNKVLFVGVPSKGSALSDYLSTKPLFRTFFGRLLNFFSSASAGKFPSFPSEAEIGVIRGNIFKKKGKEFDGFLFSDESDFSGLKSKITLPYSHIGLMRPSRILPFVLRYFSTGSLSYAHKQSFVHNRVSSTGKENSLALKVQIPSARKLSVPNLKGMKPSFKTVNSKRPGFSRFDFRIKGDFICRLFKKIKGVFFSAFNFCGKGFVFISGKVYKLSAYLFGKFFLFSKNLFNVLFNGAKKTCFFIKSSMKKLFFSIKKRHDVPVSKGISPTLSYDTSAKDKQADNLSLSGNKATTLYSDNFSQFSDFSSKGTNDSASITIKPLQERAWKEEKIQILTSSNGVSSYFVPFNGFLKN